MADDDTIDDADLAAFLDGTRPTADLVNHRVAVGAHVSDDSPIAAAFRWLKHRSAAAWNVADDRSDYADRLEPDDAEDLRDMLTLDADQAALWMYTAGARGGAEEIVEQHRANCAAGRPEAELVLPDAPEQPPLTPFKPGDPRRPAGEPA